MHALADAYDKTQFLASKQAIADQSARLIGQLALPFFAKPGKAAVAGPHADAAAMAADMVVEPHIGIVEIPDVEVLIQVYKYS